MITNSGAKLLDFGLAKFVEPAERVFSEHSAPSTRIGPLTAEGTIVVDIYRLSMKTKRSEPFLETSFSEDEPAVSPDGHLARVFLQRQRNA